ncbi:MAG: hypothetical protein QXV77_02930 [Candidatus Bathyarchaeia archaeon]
MEMGEGWLKPLKISILVVLASSAAAIGFAEFGLAYQLIDKLGYPALCQELFLEVKSNYYGVRGLNPPQTVKLNVVNLRWVEENWARGGGDDPRLEVEEAIYKALMLIPDDLSLAAVQRRQTLSIMAAASAGEIYIVEDYFNPLDQIEASKTLTHELTHIVQGYYFPGRTPSTHDESKAWNSLIEGDASYTADRYAEHLRSPKGLSIHGWNGEIPPPLMELWLFPYRYGVGFVSHLYSVGGWNLVNEAYYNPPRTTEQVIHPEKYLAGEGFQGVDLPEPKGGYEVIRTDRLGEHFIKVFLSSHVGLEEGVKASTGWNGDNFTYYKVDGEDFFAWGIAWDTHEDQVEFHESMEKLMESVEATPLGNGTWRIGWRQLKIMEAPMGKGYITYLEIATGHTSNHTREQHPTNGYGDIRHPHPAHKGFQAIPYDGETCGASIPVIEGSCISGSLDAGEPIHPSTYSSKHKNRLISPPSSNRDIFSSWTR